MELYVVRHGETDYNLQSRYAGSSDVPLNKAGYLQAEKLAKKLSGTEFDIIVSSPLIRARQTSEAIQKELGADIDILGGFSERHLGVFEGLTSEEAEERYPDLYARKCTRQLDDAPIDGETIRQFEKRVIGALKELEAKYWDKKVLLVCHGFVYSIINRHYRNIPYEHLHDYMLDNCEVDSYIITLRDNGINPRQ